MTTLLRGPKRKHTMLYLISVLIPSIFYCIPHFFEYTTNRLENGSVVVDEGFLLGMGMVSFYYKLFYYTILDVTIRIIVPVCILAFTNIKLLILFDKEVSWVREIIKNLQIIFF